MANYIAVINQSNIMMKSIESSWQKKQTKKKTEKKKKFVSSTFWTFKENFFAVDH